MQFIPVQGFRTFGLRLIFDFIFYVVWVLIGLNIILGLIVDSFNAYRDKQVNYWDIKFYTNSMLWI